MIDVGNTTEVPYLFSVSYGDDEDSLSLEYANLFPRRSLYPEFYFHRNLFLARYMLRINVEFQKAGLRGISILIASGDSGAGDAHMGCILIHAHRHACVD
jgi:tripeptidyl-peptidase-1